MCVRLFVAFCFLFISRNNSFKLGFFYYPLTTLKPSESANLHRRSQTSFPGNTSSPSQVSGITVCFNGSSLGFSGIVYKMAPIGFLLLNRIRPKNVSDISVSLTFDLKRYVSVASASGCKMTLVGHLHIKSRRTVRALDL